MVIRSCSRPAADRSARVTCAGAGWAAARTAGLHVGLGYAGAEGDFVYFNDNGTNLNQSDDSYVERTNNGYDRVDGVARAALRRGPWSLSGGARGLWKEQGVPGSASVQSRTASLTTWSQMVDATAERDAAFGVPALRARAAGHALVDIERYRDRDGEIGLAEQNRRYVTAAAGTTATLLADLSAAHASSATIEARAEMFADTDSGRAPGRRRRRAARERGLRLELAATLAHSFRLRDDIGERARIEPAVRVDLLAHHAGRRSVRRRARPGPVAAHRLSRRPARGAVAARRARPLAQGQRRQLPARADRARAVRRPRRAGRQPGARSRRPARARTRAWCSRPAGAAGPVDRLYLEAAGFAARSRDTIVWVPNAALIAGPQNLGTAWLWGGELLASARAARALTLTADYTYLDSRQRDTLPSYDGKELPQRPRHQLHGRADLAGRVASRLVVLFGDAALVSGNHLDPANLSRVPPRALVGAGLKLEIAPRLLVAVEGKNLTDARVEDIPLDPPPRPDLTSRAARGGRLLWLSAARPRLLPDPAMGALTMTAAPRSPAPVSLRSPSRCSPPAATTWPALRRTVADAGGDRQPDAAPARTAARPRPPPSPSPPTSSPPAWPPPSPSRRSTSPPTRSRASPRPTRSCAGRATACSWSTASARTTSRSSIRRASLWSTRSRPAPDRTRRTSPRSETRLYVAALAAPGVLVIDLTRPDSRRGRHHRSVAARPGGRPARLRQRRRGRRSGRRGVQHPGREPSRRAAPAPIALIARRRAWSTRSPLTQVRPFGLAQAAPAGDAVLIPTVQDFADPDAGGCLERVAIGKGTLEAAGCLVDNADLGGFVSALAWNPAGTACG